MVVDHALARPTAKIAAAFVAANQIGPEELPSLIASIASSLGSAAALPTEGIPGGSTVPTPKATAAQIRKSILPHALISFEDGKPYRALKRHLRTFGLTPDSYRDKWGLASDYPMVCPDYRAVRSALALENGLGRTSRPKASSARGAARSSTSAKNSAGKKTPASSSATKAAAKSAKGGERAAASSKRGGSKASKTKPRRAKVKPD